MTMRWRVTAQCEADEREVVLTETKHLADFISDCFVDKGCSDIKITDLEENSRGPSG